MLGNRYLVGPAVCKALLFLWMDYSPGYVLSKMTGGAPMFKLPMTCNDISYKESSIYHAVLPHMIRFATV